MENQKNNTVLYIFVGILFVLVLLLGGYIVYDKLLNNKETSTVNNNTNNDKTDKNAIEDNNNVTDNNKIDNTQPIKAEIDNNTNNASSYSKEYSTKTSYEVAKDFCLQTSAAFVFEIKNGILTLTNKSTDESSTFENVDNFKSLAYVQLYTSCFNDSIYLLTDDGNLYKSVIPLSDINNVDNLKNIFRLIDLPINVTEIGVIKTTDNPATSEELLLKDENNVEYYGDTNRFFKIS